MLQSNREKIENELLDIVCQLPFLERGMTLAPYMYPKLVEWVLADRKTTRQSLLKQMTERGPKDKPFMGETVTERFSPIVGYNLANSEWRNLLKELEKETKHD